MPALLTLSLLCFLSAVLAAVVPSPQVRNYDGLSSIDDETTIQARTYNSIVPKKPRVGCVYPFSLNGQSLPDKGPMIVLAHATSHTRRDMWEMIPVAVVTTVCNPSSSIPQYERYTNNGEMVCLELHGIVVDSVDWSPVIDHPLRGAIDIRLIRTLRMKWGLGSITQADMAEAREAVKENSSNGPNAPQPSNGATLQAQAPNPPQSRTDAMERLCPIIIGFPYRHVPKPDRTVGISPSPDDGPMIPLGHPNDRNEVFVAAVTTTRSDCSAQQTWITDSQGKFVYRELRVVPRDNLKKPLSTDWFHLRMSPAEVNALRLKWGIGPLIETELNAALECLKGLDHLVNKC